MRNLLRQIVYFFRRLKFLFKPAAKKIEIPPKATFTVTAPVPAEKEASPRQKFIEKQLAKKNWSRKRADRAWQRKQGRHPLHRDHFGTFSPIRPLNPGRHG